MFEKNTLRGVPGVYPLTAENLFRIGLALSALFQMEGRRPVLSIDAPDFVTLSIAVGFMNGGGTVKVGEGADVYIYCERGKEWVVTFGELSPEEVKRLEIILFGRAPIPRRTGGEIGRVEAWTRSGKP